jgi:amino acid transporter
MDTDHEKAQYTSGSNSLNHTSGDMKDIVQTKGNGIGEAADIYGDLATAEEYGYVERGYVSSSKARFARIILTRFQTNML